MDTNTPNIKSKLPTIVPKEKDCHKTSDILCEIAQYDKESISIGDLLTKLGDRGFGLILLIFAIPNAIPLPIPAASAITGIPLIFLAIQLILGKKKIWMPHFVAKRIIPMEMLRKVIHIARKGLSRLEKINKPRLDKLASFNHKRFAGLLIFILSVLMALPIPLGNFPLGVAITILALAITEQDGFLMVIGWVASVLALFFFFTLVNGYIWLLWEMVANFF